VLLRGLEKNGYRATLLGNVRPVKDDEDDQDADYTGIRTDADAILDVYFTRAGYAAPASDYLPWMMVGARLIAATNKARIFAQEYAYGSAFTPADTVETLTSDPKYHYADAEDLTAHAVEAAGALRTGAELIAERIVTALR